MGKDMHWIDTHCHVSDLHRNGTKRETFLEDMLEILDQCDANLRIVVSCDGKYMSDITKGPEGIYQGNRMVYELTRRAPGRIFGSCFVNPHFLEESKRVMQIAFEEWGFVQLGEMEQYMQKYKMDSDDTEQLVRLAVHYDVPVQVHLGTYWTKIHTGSVDGMDHMRDLMRAVDRVPEAKYILAHMIGCGPTPAYISYADIFLDAIKGVYGEFPRNFWVEIRDFHSPGVARTLREVPSDRILSGSDWTNRIGPPFPPYGTWFDAKDGVNPFPPSVGAFVGFLREAGATDEMIRQIGYENAEKLLKLSS